MEMEKTISGLTKQNEEYRILIKNNGLKGAKKDYKDRLFKFIFGNPENKQWTLSLYNAINGTDYTNPDDIQFNTKNQHMMDDCEPLKEYAWLVDAVRRHQSEKMDLDAAVDAALDEMPDEYVIKTFLLENRAEVKSMFLTEYNEEKVMEKERREGQQKGRQEGRQERNIEVASDLLKAGGMSVSFIAQISRLSEEAVRKLASTLGIAIL